MANRNLVRHHGSLGAHAPKGGTLYASLPMELARDPELSVYARAVAVYVWSHDEKWQQSAAAVAEAVGVNRKTATAALAELQDRGWLVREIHTAPGKTRPAWERWHLQMTNRPFTPDEIRELSAPEGVRPTDTLPGEVSATRTRRCPSHGHVGGYQTDTIEVHSGVHPEVHSSSAIDQDETGSQGRSLAVEGSEAPEGADGRGLTGPSLVSRAFGTAQGPDSDPWGGSTSEPATAAVGVEDWSQYEPGDDRDMSPKAKRIRAHVPLWRRSE